jgi:hypothetical protein
MPAGTLKRRNGAAVSNTAIDVFSRAIHGQVLLPDHSDYDGARRIWNASIDKPLGPIARCNDAGAVVATVRFAREQDLLVAIKAEVTTLPADPCALTVS